MNSPDSLDPFSRDVLEFPAVVEMVGRFLSGPLGVPALRRVRPLADPIPIQQSLDAAREADEYLTGNSRPGLARLADPTAILDALAVEGASSTAPEILTVLEVARAACEYRGLFAETALVVLRTLAEGLPDLRDLVKELDGKILPDGSIDSSASPALARIRKSIEQTRRELDSRLERLVHRLGQAELLQDELVTLRNGRYVLPVKTEKKRQVEGVVHGASSSGQSVFVEPLETLPLNNELVELEDREITEIERLLYEFSGMLSARREELRLAAQQLGEIDLAFAKAEFARHYGGSVPEFSAGREFRLSEARHPLLVDALRLSGRDAVPLTIELREPQSIVIISGPNTGGKSVALKTLGTAVLMAQAGLPVLAEEARLPVFGRVLADIGDQQSIEQNLSTFSAHIRNIQAMTAIAGPDTLALLDEIGSSTDPQEGAALAVAILESFRARRSVVFVSTHHARLKTYGAATAEALNAAMDFDEATLRPTYKFLPGLPGKSSGLDIAERLGLDPAIVAAARALLDPGASEAATLISSLHDKRAELESALADLRQRTSELQQREARLEKEAAAERREKLRELDKRLEQTLREYSERWNAALAQIRERTLGESKPAKTLAGASRRGDALARGARDEWNAQVLESLHPEQPAELAGNAAPSRVGDRVRVAGVSAPGVVTALLDGDEMEVEIGRLRMRVNRDAARVLVGGGAEVKPVTAPRGRGEADSSHDATAAAADFLFDLPGQDQAPEIPAEINVIGNTAAEARERVDEFLDRAFVAGKRRLRIIHGYGKGVLRKTLHEMLAVHPHADRFYPAPNQEGGAGATIVELKR